MSFKLHAYKTYLYHFLSPRIDPMYERFCLPNKLHLINKIFKSKGKNIFNAGPGLIDLRPLICCSFYGQAFEM